MSSVQYRSETLYVMLGVSFKYLEVDKDLVSGILLKIPNGRFCSAELKSEFGTNTALRCTTLFRPD